MVAGNQNGTGLAARSLGLKLMVILLLIVLMAVPVIFISVISFERSGRADDVTRDISQTYGGDQTLMGPVIVVPYQRDLGNNRSEAGDYVVSALTGEAVFDDVRVDEKTRSLYSVPVYTVDGTLGARLPDLDDVLPDGRGYTFDRAAAQIVVGLADVTGLQRDVTLRTGSESVVFEPYRGRDVRRPRYVPAVTRVDEAGNTVVVREAIGSLQVETDRIAPGGMTLLGLPAAALLENGEVDVSVDIALTGAPTLRVTPYARSTQLRIASAWPHPGFEGRFPPGERTITDAGFTAAWSVPFLRRGIPAAGTASEMSAMFGGVGSMGVTFVTPLNPYQTVNRALKYAVMFIGLVFLAYFLMETLLGVRVHPAQYLLIGLAQAVFYLLLLAFAEQIGFTPAFVISALATVALTSLYAGAVFGRSLIWKSALVFGTVYGLLFVLMRIQDFALMVGALVCFTAIASTLYLTRNLDWYGGKADNPV